MLAPSSDPTPSKKSVSRSDYVIHRSPFSIVNNKPHRRQASLEHNLLLQFSVRLSGEKRLGRIQRCSSVVSSCVEE